MAKPNLNKAPYFDDFDQSKNFSQLLFNPGRPVQARELTTLQSILKDQIASSTKFFLKHGDVVRPGGLTYTLAADYVRVAEIAEDPEDIVGVNLIGATSGVRGTIIFVDAGTTGEDDSVLFIKYTSAGDKVVLTRTSSSGSISIGDILEGDTSGAQIEVVSVSSVQVVGTFVNDRDFAVGETVTGDNGSFVASAITDYTVRNTFALGETLNSFVLTDGDVEEDDEHTYTVATTSLDVGGTSVSPIGTGSLATIANGIYFVDDTFTQVETQTIILNAYSSEPSCQVGLQISNEYITSDDDESLLDSAQGFPNYNAPGADRLKVVLTLAKEDLDTTPSNDFIQLMRIREGKVEFIVHFRNSEPALLSTLAERTFDESGNYTVTPFGIDIREHSVSVVDPSGRPGVYRATGDETKLAVGMTQGKGYVRGFPVEVPDVRYVEIDKARATGITSQNTINLDPGNYVLASGVYKLPKISETNDVSELFPVVDLYTDDIATIAGTGARLDSISTTQVVLPESYGAFANDVFNGGQLQLREEVGGDYRIESFDITDYASSTRTLTLSRSAAAFSEDTTTFDIVGPAPNDLDESIDDRFRGRRIGTARIRDIVLDQGEHGLTGIYRIYLFDIKIDRGFNFTQAKSMVLREDDYNGVPLSDNEPIGFRANILTQISLKNFSGVPFSEANYRELNRASQAPFTRIRSVKADGTADILYAYVLDWNENSKSLIIQSVTGLVANSDRFETNIGIGDTIEEIDQTGDKTGAYGEVVGAVKLFDTKINNLLYRLPFEFVKTITGVELFGLKRTIVKSGQDNFTVTLLRSGEKYSVATGAVSTDNIIVSFDNPTLGSFGILNDDLYSTTYSDTGSGTDNVLNLDLLVTSLPQNVILSFNVTIDKLNPRLKSKSLSGSVTEYFMDRETAQNRILSLTRCDIHELESVLMSTESDFGDASSEFETSTALDITDRYTLDNGQRDMFYDVGRVLRKPDTLQPTKPIAVTYRYFQHSDGDYFSVASYSLSQLDYADIPTYVSPNSGEKFRLTDVLDFRPTKDRHGNFTPARGAQISELPTINAWAEIEQIEYYLPRVDKIYVDENGTFGSVTGTPSLKTLVPDDPANAMVLYILYLRPYTFNTQDLRIKFIDNKRFTMRDIGKLERRIENLEEVVSLSLLEKDTADLTIIDENGLERFKNGFIVDSFNGHGIGDIDHPDYKCAIDPVLGELRPQFYKNTVDFVLDSTRGNPSDYALSPSEDIVTLSYLNSPVVQQLSASETIQVNPKHYHLYVGTLRLTPWADVGYSDSDRPVVISNTEFGKNDTFEFGANSELIHGSVYDAWRIYGDGLPIERGPDDLERTNRITGNDRSRNALTATDRNTLRGSYSAAGTSDASQLEGKRSNRSVSFAMRNNLTIQFVANGLKPNTRFYPFFDDKDISRFCWPSGETVANRTFIEIDFSGLEFSPNNSEPSESFFTIGEQLTQYPNAPSSYATYATGIIIDYNPKTHVVRLDNVTGTFVSGSGKVRLSISSLVDQPMGTSRVVKGGGLPLYSDENGTLLGNFVYVHTESGNLGDFAKFFSGHKTFKLTTSSSNSATPISRAESPFSAWYRPKKDNAAIISTRPTEKGANRPLNVALNPSEQGYWVTPLAQSFVGSVEGGYFVTRVDLYFAATDTNNLPVTVEIRTMENGNLSGDIVPNSVKTLNASEINVSDTGESVTTFIFPAPVYLRDGVEYALCVRTDSNEYRLYTSTYGSTDIITGYTISRGFPGRLFLPGNAAQAKISTTDTDLKFILYRAIFDTSKTPVVALKNVPIPARTINGLKLYTVDGSNYVRVEVANHSLPATGLTMFDGFSGDFNGISADAMNDDHEVLTDQSFDYFYINSSEAANFTGYAEVTEDATVAINAKMDAAYLSAQYLVFPDTSIAWSLQARNYDLTPNTDIISIEANNNISFDQARLVGSATTEANYTPTAGVPSCLIYAELASNSENLSPVIDLGRIGLYAIANRISDKSATDWAGSDRNLTVRIEPPYSNELSFRGDVEISLSAGNASFDQVVEIDLSSFTEDNGRLVTSADSLDEAFTEGEAISQNHPLGFATGTIDSWDSVSGTLSLNNVSGIFREAASAPLEMVDLTNGIVTTTVGCGPVNNAKAVLESTDDSLDFTDYLEVGDRVNIVSTGNVSNRVSGAIVADVNTSNIFFSYGSAETIIRKSDATQTGAVTVSILNRDNEIWSANSEATAYLATITPEKYIVITGSSYVPEENKTGSGAVFRVIDNNGANVIVDAEFSNFDANTLSNVIISQVDNIGSDLASRGGQSDCAYITKQINLEEPADAIKVLITALVPDGTWVDIFFKVLITNSTESFDDLPWVAFNPTSSDPETSLPDTGNLNSPTQFREYEFTTNPGQQEFTSFAIKICLRSTSTTIIPRVRDFRAIATSNG